MHNRGLDVPGKLPERDYLVCIRGETDKAGPCVSGASCTRGTTTRVDWMTTARDSRSIFRRVPALPHLMSNATIENFGHAARTPDTTWLAINTQQLIVQEWSTRTSIHQWAEEFVATFGLIAEILGMNRFQIRSTPCAFGLLFGAGHRYSSSTPCANPTVTIARGFTGRFSGIAPLHVPAFLRAQLVAVVAATRVFAWLPADGGE